MDGFAEGYEFFANHSSAYIASQQPANYVERIKKAINDLTEVLNKQQGKNTPTPQFKGNVAEFWHAGTFNINAAVNDSANRAHAVKSNGFASVDIATTWGDNYSSKYCKDGVVSAREQAISVFEKFKKYQSQGGRDPLDKYLADRGYTDDSVMHDPIYTGQLRLIPSDQFADAEQWLNRKITENKLTRPEQAERYVETLKLLRKKIEDNQGNESIKLTTEESRRLADLAKDGEFDPAEFGLTTEELIKFRNIMQHAFKAGMTSAVITMVLKTAPEVMKAINYLIETGSIDIEQYKQIGISAARGAAEGYINGTVSAALVTCCKAGMLGNALTSADPTVIGMVTVIAIGAIKNSYKVAKGEMTRYEMTNELIKDLFVGTCALALGSATQYVIRIPILGYLIGSFIGSAIGSVAYQTGYSAVMSFCIDTGFTMFGLVDQNYRLPKDVLEEIGIEVFDYEFFDYNSFDKEEFEFDKFEPDRFEADVVDISFIRRGVIGVSQIGYV